jgi:hypothetical protein
VLSMFERGRELEFDLSANPVPYFYDGVNLQEKDDQLRNERDLIYWFGGVPEEPSTISSSLGVDQSDF